MLASHPYRTPCMLAQLNVKYTMVPDSFPNLARSNLSIPAEVVPDIPDGWCSSFFLDTTPTRCAAAGRQAGICVWQPHRGIP